MKITNNKGISAVFDGVGKNTFKGSISCLKPRGMLVSFSDASGPLDPVDVPKDIQSKSLFLTRPTIGHYLLIKKSFKLEQIKFLKSKV